MHPMRSIGSLGPKGSVLKGVEAIINDVIGVEVDAESGGRLRPEGHSGDVELVGYISHSCHMAVPNDASDGSPFPHELLQGLFQGPPKLLNSLCYGHAVVV